MLVLHAFAMYGSVYASGGQFSLLSTSVSKRKNDDDTLTLSLAEMSALPPL